MRKTIIIAGPAGTGINTVQSFLEILLKRSGYQLLSYRNYMSRIRGGFNYTAITVADECVHAVEGRGDIVLALHSKAVINSDVLLKRGGTLIAFRRDLPETFKAEGSIVLEDQQLAKNITLKSAFAMGLVGVVLKIFGMDKNVIEQIGSAKWSEGVTAQNQTAAFWGYEQGVAQHQLPTQEDGRILVNGNQAVALGALSAGVGFYCAYPMAPSTGIMNYLGINEKNMNIVVEQAEDEIAAVISTIGASSNGVRAMTGTSGGGFSLMVEGLGFAAVSETPVVIANVQRPGPATGLPTRTEQGDLLFIAHASQGEFPRAIIAPATVEACFYETFRAFNLADRFQIPVIVLTDQQLADSTQTVRPFDPTGFVVERGLMKDSDGEYKRYDYNRIEGGRKYPGMDENLIMTDSHVHDEYGTMTENAEATIALKQKFIRRIQALKKAVKPPEYIGTPEAENVFISWGSTYGVMLEALKELTDKGHSAAVLHYTDVYPLNPAHIPESVLQAKRIINVELNAFNQFGKLLRMETGLNHHHSINRYDGRPFVLEDIVTEFEVIINE